MSRGKGRRCRSRWDWGWWSWCPWSWCRRYWGLRDRSWWRRGWRWWRGWRDGCTGRGGGVRESRVRDIRSSGGRPAGTPRARWVTQLEPIRLTVAIGVHVAQGGSPYVACGSEVGTKLVQCTSSTGGQVANTAPGNTVTHNVGAIGNLHLVVGLCQRRARSQEEESHSSAD